LGCVWDRRNRGVTERDKGPEKPACFREGATANRAGVRVGGRRHCACASASFARARRRAARATFGCPGSAQERAPAQQPHARWGFWVLTRAVYATLSAFRARASWETAERQRRRRRRRQDAHDAHRARTPPTKGLSLRRPDGSIEQRAHPTRVPRGWPQRRCLLTAPGQRWSRAGQTDSTRCHHRLSVVRVHLAAPRCSAGLLGCCAAVALQLPTGPRAGQAQSKRALLECAAALSPPSLLAMAPDAALIASF
jgi:hypothetical protein